MNTAQLLFPDFALIVFGYLICRHTALDRSVWQAVERLVYYLLFPVLLFQSIAQRPIDFGAASHLALAGLITGAIGIGLAYALPYVLRRWMDPHTHAGAAQVAFRFNSFIALALADRLAGSEGLLWISVLIGVCVPLFNIAAVWPMARQGQQSFGRELLHNPLILATALGLLANVLQLHIPDWVSPTLQRIGNASIALGLMAAGAGMQLGSMRSHRALSASVLSIRHLITPLVALGVSYCLSLPPAQSLALMIFAALPTSSSCYVLAARMGYNGPYVAGLVTFSTVFGMLSLPFALWLLRW